MKKSGGSSVQEKFVNKFKTRYAFLYVTERCNLNCEYCYFRHREGRDLPLELVGRFFDLLEREGAVPPTLVFSGGEVFLLPEDFFAMLNRARHRFPETSLHVQTNGVLIDRSSIRQLRELGVSLEFGIDGDPAQTLRHRRGLDASLFERLTDNIRACLDAGISCGCTLTVHPDEVRHMEAGVEFIQGLGITQVDVTPAAFMPWTSETIGLFKKNYLALMRQAHFRKLFYCYDDMECIKPGTMDLSLHPSGHLLAGDPFLCLSEAKREQYNLWDISSGELKRDVLSFYQDAYQRMFDDQECVLYREYVCRSFELVNMIMGEEYLNAGAINEILRFLTRAHRALRSVVSQT